MKPASADRGVDAPGAVCCDGGHPHNCIPRPPHPRLPCFFPSGFGHAMSTISSEKLEPVRTRGSTNQHNYFSFLAAPPPPFASRMTSTSNSRSHKRRGTPSEVAVQSPMLIILCPFTTSSCASQIAMISVNITFYEAFLAQGKYTRRNAHRVTSMYNHGVLGNWKMFLLGR